MTKYVLAFGGAFLFAAAVGAQDPGWQIPPEGAIEYAREWRAAAGEPVGSRRAAQAAPAVGKVPEGWVSRLAPAPNLCQGELRTDRRAPEGQVHDVRDVLRHLAFDLGSRSGVRAQFARLMPFGDVTVSGSWSGVDGDGVQTLRADWSARLPRPVSGEERDVAERLRVFCVADSDGQVTMRRRIDAAAGRVAEWDGELDLVVEEPQKQFRRLVVHDEWRFTAVRDNQDAEFRKRVAAGIAGGVAFVRDAIDEKKSFLQDKRGEERDFGSGRLALALLTMVHGHVPADDSVLQRGFADLRRRRLTDTYSLAAALMAVAARCAPPDEAELLRSGRLAGRPPRQMDPADRKAADKWLQRLLGNVDPRTDPSDVLRFNYEAGPRYDTSLQQYALLGMWSAQLCGLDVPQGSFAAAARHLLAVQAPALSRAPLSVRTYAQQRLLDQGDRVPQVSPRRVAVRGFAYQEPEEPPFGSMTSAGISGLLLARAGMQAQGDGDRKVLGGIDDAVDAGFAWLGDNFSVRCNPGFAERAGRHWYYWLYGLERSCELFGIARLQDRDWYFEGALQLLAQQQPNGSFKAEHASTLLLDSTCFAVLFLARSTAPAAITTGR